MLLIARVDQPGRFALDRTDRTAPSDGRSRRRVSGDGWRVAASDTFLPSGPRCGGVPSNCGDGQHAQDAQALMPTSGSHAGRLRSRRSGESPISCIAELPLRADGPSALRRTVSEDLVPTSLHFSSPGWGRARSLTFGAGMDIGQYVAPSPPPDAAYDFRCVSFCGASHRIAPSTHENRAASSSPIDGEETKRRTRRFGQGHAFVCRDARQNGSSFMVRT